MNKKIFIFAAAITLSFFLLNIIPVSAADLNLKNAFFGDGNLLGQVAEKGGYKSDTSETTALYMIGIVIETFLGILGVIFLVLMILAGYNWMTAHGDEQKVTKAKDTIRQAIIGLIVVLGAYAISYYVIKYLGDSTLQNNAAAGSAPSVPAVEEPAL
jgi:hypothetical protein